MSEPKSPLNGQYIILSAVPPGSLLRADIVYRTERKINETEFLLIDVASGHAGRIPEHNLMYADWADAGDRAPKRPQPAPEPQAEKSEGDEFIGAKP